MMEISEITESLLDYEYREPLLPIGDFHAINTYAIYSDEYTDSMKEDPKEAKRLRGVGKTVGLSLMYGGTEYTVSDKLGITMDEATPIVEKFYSGVPTLKRFHTGQQNFAKKNRYTPNIFGGKRYLPHIVVDRSKIQSDKDRKMAYSLMGKMMRLALNAPIQSASAVQILLIIMAVNKFIESNRLTRVYGNLKVTYRPYTRVIAIDEATPEIESYLDSLPDGHVKIVVGTGDSFEQEYDRNVAITTGGVDRIGGRYIW